MYVIEFGQDVLRFAKHGLLLRFCWLLVARMEVLLCACMFAAIFEYASSPPTQFMVGILAIGFAGVLFVTFTVLFLSPLYFGSFAVGRLDVKARPLARLGSVYDQFILVPEGTRLYVTYWGKNPRTGVIGNRYLLLQHPADKEAALALIDDDTKYMDFIRRRIDNARAAEISERLDAFRRTTPLAE